MAFFKQFFGEDVLTPQLIDVTYEWRAKCFTTVSRFDETHVSDIFEVGKDSYTLELTRSFEKKSLSVKLVQVKPREPALKFLCSAGLVDLHGKVRHFVRKEVELGKGCETKELLNIPLEVFYEEKCDVFQDGCLSVQLTINLPTEHEWLLTPSVPCERGLESLARDMGKLLEDKTGSDVMLKVGDTVFKAHRLILSARSPVFVRMFDRNDSCERNTFDITDVDSSIFEHALRYIYTDQVGVALTPGNAHKLIETAERYCIQELKRSCINFLATNLTIENVCEAILLTEKFDDKRLKEAVYEFLSENANEILRSKQWKNFKTKNTAIANSVLSSILLSKKAN